MTNDNLTVSDHKYLDKKIGTANRNRSYDVYRNGKTTKAQQIDLAFDKVRDELMDDLFEAETRADIYDLLHASICYTINHYDMCIEPEDVMPYFWKKYGLND